VVLCNAPLCIGKTLPYALRTRPSERVIRTPELTTHYRLDLGMRVFVDDGNQETQQCLVEVLILDDRNRDLLLRRIVDKQHQALIVATSKVVALMISISRVIAGSGTSSCSVSPLTAFPPLLIQRVLEFISLHGVVLPKLDNSHRCDFLVGH
jgi:hypothetical protein